MFSAGEKAHVVDLNSPLCPTMFRVGSVCGLATSEKNRIKPEAKAIVSHFKNSTKEGEKPSRRNGSPGIHLGLFGRKTGVDGTTHAAFLIGVSYRLQDSLGLSSAELGIEIANDVFVEADRVNALATLPFFAELRVEQLALIVKAGYALQMNPKLPKILDTKLKHGYMLSLEFLHGFIHSDRVGAFANFVHLPVIPKLQSLPTFLFGAGALFVW